MLYGPLQNNPKPKLITLEVNKEIRIIGKIQIGNKGDIYFYPDNINSLYFTGNGFIQIWPHSKDHISFHRDGRVHIGKDGYILDVNNNSSSKNPYIFTRNNLSDIKSQILFKIRIPNISFISISKSGIGDIHIIEDAQGPLIFSIGLVDGGEFSNALKTGNDPYGLRHISPAYQNTAMYGFGMCKDSNEIQGGRIFAKKFLFIVIRPFESSSVENFDNYPYIMTIPKESPLGGIPY